MGIASRSFDNSPKSYTLDRFRVAADRLVSEEESAQSEFATPADLPPPPLALLHPLRGSHRSLKEMIDYPRKSGAAVGGESSVAVSFCLSCGDVTELACDGEMSRIVVG
jgi:hypothetical protein